MALCSATARADEPELPSVSDPDSHTKFLDLLAESRATTYRKILALYDKWLAEKPGSPAVALERCRFILAAGADEEDEFDEGLEPAEAEGGDEEEEEDCTLALLERYPRDPSMVLFRLEHLWGDAKIEFGLATSKRTDIQWPKSEGARFAQHLAYAFFSDDDLPKAVHWALMARERSSEIDVAIILATHLQQKGLYREAAAELSRPSGETEYAFQKVDMLLELEAFQEAVKVIREAERQGGTVPTLAHAKALEGAGDTEAARTKYAELSDQQWNKSSVLRRLFYIDLARSDGARALASYRALRDQGFKADPMLRHRLALALAFPLLPWQWRELLGLFGLLGVALLFALAPGVLLLPAHYVGLVRAARNPTAAATPGDWTLFQVWGLFATMLLADMVATYVFAYETLQAWFFDASNETFQVEAAARYGVLTFVLSGCAVFAWTRRTDYRGLLRSTWNPGEVAASAVVGLVAIFIVQGISKVIAAALGIFGENVAPAPLGISGTTAEIVTAIIDSYGAWVALPLIAIVVPVYEEIAFRGVLLGWTSRYLPFGWANALQAVTFTLAHDAPDRYPGLFATALLAGVFARRASGLAPAIAVHMLLNLVAGSLLMAAPALQRFAWDNQRLEMPRITRPKVDDPVDLERRCNGGDLRACSAAAWDYRDGKGVEKDLERAAQLHQKACDGGRIEDCSALGYLYSEGLGVIRDDATALRLYTRACDGRYAAACNNLGTAYEFGRGVEQNYVRAAELYGKASDTGSRIAANNLGLLYMNGRGVEKDFVMSAGLFRKSCDAGEALACGNLGHCYENGLGVEKDLARRDELFAKACEGGVERLCRTSDAGTANPP